MSFNLNSKRLNKEINIKITVRNKKIWGSKDNMEDTENKKV